MALEKSLVSISIPQEIRNCLQQYQDEHNIKMTSSAVEIILGEYFQISNGTKDILLHKFNQLEDKVMVLIQHIEMLKINLPSSTLLETNLTTPHYNSSIYSEIDDEPCEVLTSFLES